MAVKKIHKKSKAGGEKKIELDFGLGKLSLGGIFDGIEKIVDLADKAEKAGGELRREGTIKGFGGRGDARGVYGFTVRTGIGGKKSPHIETFGNIKKTKKGPKVEETREPIVDVFDEKGYVSIIVELPGVAERDIKISFKGDILIMEAGSKARKYSKEIVLPGAVDVKSRKTKFHNGILEVEFKKISGPGKSKNVKK